MAQAADLHLPPAGALDHFDFYFLRRLLSLRWRVLIETARITSASVKRIGAYYRSLKEPATRPRCESAQFRESGTSSKVSPECAVSRWIRRSPKIVAGVQKPPGVAALSTSSARHAADLHGKPLAKRGLASILGKYGVRPTKVTVRGKSLQGYRREHLWDAWVRYLPPLCSNSARPELPEFPASLGAKPVPAVPVIPEIRQEKGAFEGEAF